MQKSTGMLFALTASPPEQQANVVLCTKKEKKNNNAAKLCHGSFVSKHVGKPIMMKSTIMF